MNKKRGAFIAVIMLLNFVVVWWAFAKESGLPSNTVGFMTEFPVPTTDGGPQNVVVESAGPPARVWVARPEANVVTRLVVTDTVSFSFTNYPLPTSDSEPYDLAYDAGNGRIWFTERARPYIGYVTIATGVVQEFEIPNGGLPHSIAIAPNGLIWFTQPEANNLVKYDPVGDIFSAYGYAKSDGTPVANAEPTKISITTNTSVWITAPGVNQMTEFRPATETFVPATVVDFGSPSVPPSDVFALNNVPWIANPVDNRIGRFLPETLAFFRWYDLPADDTGIDSLFITQSTGLIHVWYTEPNNGRVGQMNLENSNFDVVGHALHQLPSSSGVPADIVVDSSGTAWIADQGGDAIVRWQAPYNVSLFLPIVQRP